MPPTAVGVLLGADQRRLRPIRSRRPGRARRRCWCSSWCGWPRGPRRRTCCPAAAIRCRRPPAARSTAAGACAAAWKVSACTEPTPQLCAKPRRCARNRARISPAARWVNVTASTWPAATWPSVTSCAIRCVMVRVLPVPAPASTQTGPRGASTASRCSSIQSGGQWVCDHRHGVHLGSDGRQTGCVATPFRPRPHGNALSPGLR